MVQFRSLHFHGSEEIELLLIQDLHAGANLVYKLFYFDPTVKEWVRATPGFSRDYAIVTRITKKVHRHLESDQSHWEARVTFANGHGAIFAASEAGYLLQKGAPRKTMSSMNYDKAAMLYRNCNQPPEVQGIQSCNSAQSKKGNTEMNINEMITIMQLEAGAKVVRASYLDNGAASASYSFKNVVGLDLKEGDMIVCETRDTYALLRVEDPDVMASDVNCPLGDLKHVVAKIRNDNYVEAKQAEANAHRQLALSEVTSRLSTYRKQVGEGAFNTVASLLGIEATASAAEDDSVVE